MSRRPALLACLAIVVLLVIGSTTELVTGDLVAAPSAEDSTALVASGDTAGANDRSHAGPYWAEVGREFTFRYTLRQSLQSDSEEEESVDLEGRLSVGVLGATADHLLLQLTGDAMGMGAARGFQLRSAAAVHAKITHNGRVVSLGAAAGEDPRIARLLATVFLRSHQFPLDATNANVELIDESGPCLMSCRWDGSEARRRKLTVSLRSSEIPGQADVEASEASATFFGTWLATSQDVERIRVDVGGMVTVTELRIAVHLEYEDSLERRVAFDRGSSIAAFFATVNPPTPTRPLDDIIADLLRLSAQDLESEVGQALHGELVRRIAAHPNDVNILVQRLRSELLPPRVPMRLTALLASVLGAAARNGEPVCVAALAGMISDPPMEALRINFLVASHGVRPDDASRVQPLVAAILAGESTWSAEESGAAWLTLASLNRNAATPEIAQAVGTKAANLRAAGDFVGAADLAANSGRSELLGDAESMVSDDRESVREALAQALEKFAREPTAGKLLTKLCADSSESVRADAARSLGFHPASVGVASLAQLAGFDSSESVRAAAVQSLGRFLLPPGNATAEAALIAVSVNDQEHSIRELAKMLLAARGPGHMRR